MLSSRFQIKPMRLIRLVSVFALFGYANLNAQTPFDDLKLRLYQALEENAKKVNSAERKAKITKLYSDKLTELRAEFSGQGSLDGVIRVQDEISRLEKSEGIPSKFSPNEKLAHLQKIYAEEMKKIESEKLVGVLNYYNIYSEQLVEEEKELVRKGFIKKAVKIRQERVRVKEFVEKLIERQSAPLPKVDRSTPLDPEGTPRLGRVPTQNESEWDVRSRPAESTITVLVAGEPRVVRNNPKLENKAFDALKAQFDELVDTHWEIVASDEREQYEKYMRELRIRRFYYQNQGSLDGVLALEAAMKRLEDLGIIPKSNTKLKHLEVVQENFAKDIKRLKSSDRARLLEILGQYLSELEKLENSLVQKDLLKKAIVIRNEIKRATKIVRNMSRKELVLHLFEASQPQISTSKE